MTGLGELGLEPRLLIAYSLIAVLALSSGVGGLVIGRRRRQRRLRLRGIKTDERPRSVDRRAA